MSLVVRPSSFSGKNQVEQKIASGCLTRSSAAVSLAVQAGLEQTKLTAADTDGMSAPPLARRIVLRVGIARDADVEPVAAADLAGKILIVVLLIRRAEFASASAGQTR